MWAALSVYKQHGRFRASVFQQNLLELRRKERNTYLSYGEKKEIGDSFRNKNSQLKNLHEAYYHD